ncbi:MAG: thiamine pyrophosphate-dependent dehydrogenase E1 component subunit alpha [Bdellovibrionales bacterium]|nr:thiamine pyrophosphate-dependent dehydrogenase E1 component subunit alpha [Bdellovibrionales bacterium]
MTDVQTQVSATEEGTYGGLTKEKLKEMYQLMVRSRALEERLIKIYKAGESYFWIGAPGEEAFGVPLGMLVNKGQGHDHDWLHLHYRSTPTLVALGMPLIDSIRLTMNRATDPNTGGRNFCNHYFRPEWNVAPVGSPIEVQYSMAIGTAWAQRRNKAKGVTIVTGGDAGTAEGDFATSLVWASRKGYELPMLICVTNNGWGISTEYNGQHGEESISDRGLAFGIKTVTVNGNDPIATYNCIQNQLDYIRKTGKPVLLEATVSRLFGHSSADGANRRPGIDCVEEFEEYLLAAGVITAEEAEATRKIHEKEAQEAQYQARQEQGPTPESIWDHVYYNNENANWRAF